MPQEAVAAEHDGDFVTFQEEGVQYLGILKEAGDPFSILDVLAYRNGDGKDWRMRVSGEVRAPTKDLVLYQRNRTAGVEEDSDQVKSLVAVGDEVVTEKGVGIVTNITLNSADYGGEWQLEPPSVEVELEDGSIIHTCICSLELPDDPDGTELLHSEFDRLWPPVTDEVPEDADMLIPEGEEEMTRRGKFYHIAQANRNAFRRQAALSLKDLELESWIGSESDEFWTLVFRLLASLPGGDEAEEVGYEPFPYIGWKEIELITEMLDKIQGARDVEQLVSELISWGREEEEDESPDSY